MRLSRPVAVPKSVPYAVWNCVGGGSLMRQKLNRRKAEPYFMQACSVWRFSDIPAITVPPFLDCHLPGIAVCKVKGGG